MPNLRLDDNNGNYLLLSRRWYSYQHSHCHCYWNWLVRHQTSQIDCKLDCVHWSRNIESDDETTSMIVHWQHNPPKKLIILLHEIVFASDPPLQGVMPSLKVLFNNVMPDKSYQSTQHGQIVTWMAPHGDETPIFPLTPLCCCSHCYFCFTISVPIFTSSSSSMVLYYFVS